MAVLDDFLFADFLLDSKFRFTTEVLEQFVMNSSQDLSVARIAEHTGRSTREVTQICKKLQIAGLLQPSKTSAKVWMLVCDPSTITLEDVYRGMLVQSRRNTDTEIPAMKQSSSVDLLIMQATMEVNQSISRHLRQFSLGRPKNSHFSSSRH